MSTIAKYLVPALIVISMEAPLGADSIQLRTGAWIDGKVSDVRSTPTHLVIEVDGVGSLTILREQVVLIEKNDRKGLPPAGEGQPAPAARKDSSRVRLKKGEAFYGTGSVYGVPSPHSTDRTLVLTVPGGEMRLSREAVEKAEPFQPVEAAARLETIPTSHVIHLKNGSRIRGTVIPGPEKEPLKVELRSLGWVVIPRDRIERIEESAGEIRLPEEKPEEGQAPPPAPPTPGAGQGKEEARPVPATTRTAPGIDPELREEIERNLSELTRWRSRNRTRAENALARIGSPAIPRLERAARDPFELTRRAAMRIIRDVGDPQGLPMAIDALLDEDVFVRELAGEALRRITGLDLGFRPRGSLEERVNAHRRWRRWWEER